MLATLQKKTTTNKQKKKKPVRERDNCWSLVDNTMVLLYDSKVSNNLI